MDILGVNALKLKAIGQSFFLSALSFQHLLFEHYEPIRYSTTRA
jgi:hypothetical protein